MFGYRKIKWTRSKNKWVSDCEKYEIAKDGYIYFAQEKVEQDGVKFASDWQGYQQLAKAKKWCDDRRQKNYLHELQLHINSTNRYGKAGE